MIVPGGSPFGFNYTDSEHSPSLFFKAKIYDITIIGSPVLVTQVVLTYLFAGSYNGLFTGVDGKVYAVIITAYTDITYATIDTMRSPITYTFECISIGTDLSALTTLVNALKVATQAFFGGPVGQIGNDEIQTFVEGD